MSQTFAWAQIVAVLNAANLEFYDVKTFRWVSRDDLHTLLQRVAHHPGTNPPLAWLPFCEQPFAGSIDPSGGDEPICVRCFMPKGAHLAREKAAVHEQ